MAILVPLVAIFVCLSLRFLWIFRNSPDLVVRPHPLTAPILARRPLLAAWMDRPRTRQDRAPAPLCLLPTSPPTRPSPPWWRWKRSLRPTHSASRSRPGGLRIGIGSPPSSLTAPANTRAPASHPRQRNAAFEIRRRRMSPARRLVSRPMFGTAGCPSQLYRHAASRALVDLAQAHAGPRMPTHALPSSHLCAHTLAQTPVDYGQM